MQPVVYQVKQRSSIKEVIEFCKSRIEGEEFHGISLVGESKAVNKTISISEILKKIYPDLTQSIQLESSEKDENEPKLTIIVSKKIE